MYIYISNERNSTLPEERFSFSFSVTNDRVLFFFFLIDKMYKHDQHAHICATNDVKLLNHESIQRYASTLRVIRIQNQITGYMEETPYVNLMID
jgi:hypothetical protein